MGHGGIIVPYRRFFFFRDGIAVGPVPSRVFLQGTIPDIIIKITFPPRGVLEGRDKVLFRPAVSQKDLCFTAAAG